jgi:hypothetical protein
VVTRSLARIDLLSSRASNLSPTGRRAHSLRWIALLALTLPACSAYDPRLLIWHFNAPLPGDGGSAQPDASAPDSGDAEPSDGGVIEAGPDADVDAGEQCGDTLTDVENCGSCDHICQVSHGVPGCVEGSCVIASCESGFSNCDEDQATCETSILDLSDCGGCGIPCRDLPHAVPTCGSGQCAIASCEAGYADCDQEPKNGCEVSLGTLTDCGVCGAACSKASCSGGVCTAVTCQTGFGDCDGDQVTCEANLSTDPVNCGNCGSKCQFNAGVTPHATISCAAARCGIQCASGFIDCNADFRDGCEAAYSDADSDGVADCMETCDNDPLKRDPGICGCGTPDTDTDIDGTVDCNDGCPLDPTQAGACLGYAPANFDPKGVNWNVQPVGNLTCGTTTIDTTDPDGSGPLVATISNWCGTAPTPFAQSQNGGPQVVVIPLKGMTLVSGNTIRVVGPRPIIFGVSGAASIAGTIDASASGTTPGAGGNYACGSAQGGNGSGETKRFGGASGGGGGGFGTAGGKAGTADTDGSDTAGGSAGATRGGSSLAPLLGGCAGGQAGDCSSAGAAGGGAVQISASGTLTISGTIRANGGSGATPCGSNDEGGGTGGGSGGGIFLEGKAVSTGGSTIQANGGSGGHNGQYAGVYNCGDSNGGSGSTSSSSAGGGGVSCQGGSSGGGGGYGRVRTLTH